MMNGWRGRERPARGEGPEEAQAGEPTEDIQEVFEALKKGGHSPFYIVLDGADETLLSLARTEADLFFKPDGVYRGDDTKDTNIAAYLGSPRPALHRRGPGGALTSPRTKPLAKKIFSFSRHRDPVLRHRVPRAPRASQDIRFPLIVKPAREDGSIGIEFSAVVNSIKELMERIDALHMQFDSPVPPGGVRRGA